MLKSRVVADERTGSAFESLERGTVLVLRHEQSVSLGSLADEFRAAAVPFSYVDLFRETPPRLPLDAAAGLVILGGTMNVDQVERHPFLALELDWIREAIDRRLPTLGICLGAQLMAKALGRRVFRNPVKEIGWFSLRLRDEAASDPLLVGAERSETVFQWHGDTFDLPAGVAHLAETTTCPHQFFRAGPAAWAVQFHVEMTEALLGEWLSAPEFAADLASAPHVDRAAIVAQLPARLPAMRRFSGQILGRFAALCQRGHTAG